MGPLLSVYLVFGICPLEHDWSLHVMRQSVPVAHLAYSQRKCVFFRKLKAKLKSPMYSTICIV